MNNEIRKYIDILSESSVERAYRQWSEKLAEAGETKTKPDIDLDNLFRDEHNDIATTTKTDVTATDQIGRPRRTEKPVTIRKSVPAPDIDASALGHAEMDDDWGDLDVDAPQLQAPAVNQRISATTDDEVEKIASNLPVPRQSTELANVPKDLIQYVNDIEWHNLTTLPGYAKQMIRNMGRRVFKAFGEMEMEDIDTISTLTHDEEDLDAVAKMVTGFGNVVVDEAEIDFGDVMPNYTPVISIWELGGQYYKFVNDDHGRYIYTWKHVDTNMLPKWDKEEAESQNKSLSSPSSDDLDDLDDLINDLY